MNPAPDPREDQVAPRWWRMKFACERIAALVLFVILLPLLVLLGLLVKMTSPGPVLYVSDRLGRDGRVFRLFKFRSMKDGARQILGEDGKVLAFERDPRLTSIGGFLRLGFDELPQLVNVIRGDMCLVGPRPDVPWEKDRYTGRERLRLEVLPGITGLAQVVGGRNMSNAANYELDVLYVTRSSIWTDVKVALLTLPYSLGWKNVGQAWFAEEVSHVTPRESHPSS